MAIDPKTSTILFGDTNPLADTVSLNAGPLKLIFQNGMIRTVTCNEVPVVNRVYFALRDQNWNTIPGTIRNFESTIREYQFKINYQTLYALNDIELLCDFDIKGDKSGEIIFSFRAEALSSFKRSRIGFCTLLPIDTCTGKPLIVETSEHKRIERNFPTLLEPWQPLLDIKNISYSPSDTAHMSITFDGDIFEMEDQRNWTDYSFKIYSTRLSDPVPVIIEKGTVIKQCITIKASSSISMQSGESQLSSVIHLRNSVTNNNSKVPAIGSSIDITAPYNGNPSLYASLAHIRTDLYFDKQDISNDIRKVIALSKSHTKPLELAVYFTNNISAELLLLCSELESSSAHIARFLIFKPSEPIISEATITITMDALCKAFPGIPLVYGTDRYFVDLNRNRMSIDKCDNICYSMNPQVHTFDNESIIENLPGVESTLQTANVLWKEKKIHITPITLRPRTNRANPAKAGGPDNRSLGLFSAAWTVGNLMYCIRNGVHALTYFQMNGECGLIDNKKQFITPSYHVLASIAPFYGASANTLLSSNDRQIAAIHLQKSNGTLILAANLTDMEKTINLSDLQGDFTYQCIDITTFDTFTSNYTEWASTWHTLPKDRAASFRLSAFGILVVRVD